MPPFAYDDDPERAATPALPRSQFRIRVAPRHASALARLLDAFAGSITQPSDRDVVLPLHALVLAAAELEEKVTDLGATHVTRAWMRALVDWMNAMTADLSSAFRYRGQERAAALALVAEESSMRLDTELSREAAETASVLRNLDRNAADAANELAAAIELADRCLATLR